MPAILLARHAQASFGAADYDVLSEIGVRQAAVLAAHLAGRGLRVDRLVSGSLRRQRDTAAPVAEDTGRAIEVDPRWDEYAGDDILAHHGGSAARLEHPPDAAPALSSRDFQQVLERALHGWIEAGDASPAAETWPAFAARTRAALDELGASLGSGETALVVTSGGVLGALGAGLVGAPPAAFVTLNRVMVNGALTKVIRGRGGATLVSLNEHAHLEREGAALVTYR